MLIGNKKSGLEMRFGPVVWELSVLLLLRDCDDFKHE